MGFLGMGYTKDGKGVSKDDAEKNGFFMFFELFGRKFVKFLKLNMLYFAVSIPYLIILFFVSMKVVSFSEIFSMTETIKAQQALGLDALMRLTFITLVFVFWGAGPAAAGFAYTLRNYAREEHVWLVSDFFEKMKENFKYGLIIMVMDLIVFAGGLLSMHFYLMQSIKSPIWMIPQVFLIVVLLLYTIMHTYMYQIMVTFKLSFSKLIKNALFMAIAKFPMNLVLSIIVIAITCVLMYTMAGMWLLLIPFIYVSFVGFILHYYAATMIKRNFIDPFEEDKEKTVSIFEEK